MVQDQGRGREGQGEDRGDDRIGEEAFHGRLRSPAGSGPAGGYGLKQIIPAARDKGPPQLFPFQHPEPVLHSVFLYPRRSRHVPEAAVEAGQEGIAGVFRVDIGQEDPVAIGT